ncbi:MULTISPECIES: nitroreductase family protein [unclassified Pseudomonas]|uniref:nitroreductase family protein n=1 Tax=unclassified Pseudomonas TaxID=196821 RepID=UPI000BD3E4A1|nr:MULTISPECIES: nitroreductase family protein [unclassified Pseudomonas]PVZ20789.1 nitroreductase [Pseudomonas sp. URIL14HWK12:I12]PVZ27855.1 nitroreductase [Pseudomonas sp. URIL14HWK12:I10]PVZ38744.1 nitroreductase [Pseudomonas sp. URIL14HWK12:I11]SNZ02191.1 Nitroreductase [Pseudomonas sp. URIL14HWK12:I9]
MDALDALLQRVSVGRLVAPAPSAEQREILFQAAFRAPDHKVLHPYRFLTIEGEGLSRLGELLAEATAASAEDVPQAAVDKARKNPLRAPLIVVAIACLQEHPKVPASEQLLTAGCAAHGLILAAYAQGIGAMWRSGEVSFSSIVAQGLGLAANEQVIGFIYLGTAETQPRSPAPLPTGDYVSAWAGQ